MSSKTERPHVSINMAMSADGKVSTCRRETFSLGSGEDRYMMDVIRAKVGAVVVGSQTLRLDGWAMRIRYPDLRRRRVQKGLAPHPLNVVLSTDLNLKPGKEFFSFAGTEKLVITTRRAPRARLRRFEKLSDVVVLPRERIRPGDVLDILWSRGIKRVLVEGGGTLNFSFFEAGLVDELYLTITPRILGGATSPTVADGRGFLKRSHPRLELVSSRRRGDELFLRYRVVKR